MSNEEETARRFQKARDLSRKFAAMGVQLDGCGCCGTLTHEGLSWGTFMLTEQGGEWSLEASYYDHEIQKHISFKEVFTLSQG